MKFLGLENFLLYGIQCVGGHVVLVLMKMLYLANSDIS